MNIQKEIDAFNEIIYDKMQIDASSLGSQCELMTEYSKVNWIISITPTKIWDFTQKLHPILEGIPPSLIFGDKTPLYYTPKSC